MTYHLGHDDYTTDIFTLVSNLPTDLTLISTEGDRVDASSILLSIHSSLLRNLIREQGCKETVISVPLSILSIKILLSILENGTAFSNKEEDLLEVSVLQSCIGLDLDQLQLGKGNGTKEENGTKRDCDEKDVRSSSGGQLL